MSPDFLNRVASRRIYETAVDLIKLWTHKSRLACGRAFNASDDVNRAALDAIWAVAFGNQIGTTKSQVDALAKVDAIDLPGDTQAAAIFPTPPAPPAFESIITLTKSMDIPLSSPFPRPHYWLALKLFPYLR